MSDGNHREPDERFKTVTRESRYHHNVYTGTFTGEPTVRDLEKAYFCHYFGGRGAELNYLDRTFRVIEHTD